MAARYRAIEAINGQNSPAENERALAAAEKLGLTALGGSDAHFPTPHWFLTCATELERPITTWKSYASSCAPAARARIDSSRALRIRFRPCGGLPVVLRERAGEAAQIGGPPAITSKSPALSGRSGEIGTNPESGSSTSRSREHGDPKARARIELAQRSGPAGAAEPRSASRDSRSPNKCSSRRARSRRATPRRD